MGYRSFDTADDADNKWVWREGVVPQLSTAGLEALQNALESDDPTLIQGQNLLPPPLQRHEFD